MTKVESSFEATRVDESSSFWEERTADQSSKATDSYLRLSS